MRPVGIMGAKGRSLFHDHDTIRKDAIMKTLVVAALSIVLCGAVYSKMLSPSDDSPIAHTLGSMSKRVDAAVQPGNRIETGRPENGRKRSEHDTRSVKVSDYVALHKTRSEHLP